jgi:hypothetical protein
VNPQTPPENRLNGFRDFSPSLTEYLDLVKLLSIDDKRGQAHLSHLRTA